jgi:hypothetical protein
MAHISEDPACCAPSPRAGRAPRHRQRGLRRAGGRGQQPSSGAMPRSSTSASSTAWAPSAWRSNLGIEQKAAKDYIDRYFARFAGVKRYMDETGSARQGQGLCRDRVRPPPVAARDQQRQRPAPRRRRAPGHQRADAGHGGRPHQAGDDRRAAALDAQGRATRMVMQVHDELVLEVPEAELDWAREAIPRLMAGVAQLKVPLLAEVGVGPTGTRRTDQHQVHRRRQGRHRRARRKRAAAPRPHHQRLADLGLQCRWQTVRGGVADAVDPRLSKRHRLIDGIRREPDTPPKRLRRLPPRGAPPAARQSRFRGGRLAWPGHAGGLRASTGGKAMDHPPFGMPPFVRMCGGWWSSVTPFAIPCR